MDRIDEYFCTVSSVLAGLVESDIHCVASMIDLCKGHIFVFGNGGSGSTASHFAQDMNKLLNKRFICLNDNTASVLAYGNDDGFKTVFRSQLAKFIRSDDLVIGFSCSGNSENVLEAIALANEFSVPTIGFCGFDGGKLKSLASQSIHVNLNDMQICEDTHLILTHLILKLINNRHENHRN